jgi:hypothetical protein
VESLRQKHGELGQEAEDTRSKIEILTEAIDANNAKVEE